MHRTWLRITSLAVAAKSRDPTMAVRPTQLGLRSSGGSVRDPPAAPALVARGLFQLQVRSTGTGANWRAWVVRSRYGSDPKSAAIAAARRLPAEPGHQGRSLILWHPGRGNHPGPAGLGPAHASGAGRSRPTAGKAPSGRRPAGEGPDPASGRGAPPLRRRNSGRPGGPQRLAGNSSTAGACVYW
jgi:hypothetical protein